VENVERLSTKTGYPISKALEKLDVRKPRFYDWKRRKGQENQHNGQIPKDTWILPEERTAILDFFSKNPLNGCRRLSYMMIDEDVAYVSGSTVHRVLKAEGLIDSQNSSSGKKGTGFVQPIKPHEQWHIDVSYINAGGTFYYLCSILDGHSRFIVHWDLKESMKENDVELIVQMARERFPDEKPRLISDNGPQFKAREFRAYIRFCGMEQTFTSPYYPQSNGKIERWHKELKQTCIRPKAPRTLEEAKECVEEFVEQYNYQRLHSSIGYVTPFDKLLGINDDLKRERAEKLEKARLHRKNAWKAIQSSKESLAMTA